MKLAATGVDLQFRAPNSAFKRRVSPTTRDAPLRMERLGVEIPHAAPLLNEECRTKNEEWKATRQRSFFLHSSFSL